MLLGLLAFALAEAGMVLIPLVIANAINTVDSLYAITEPDKSWNIQLYIIQIAGLAVFIAIGRYLMRRFLGYAATGIEYDIRHAYFARLLTLPLSYHQRQRTGDLMARATNDLQAVLNFFTFGVRGFLTFILAFTYSVILMCTMHWQLTLIVILPLALLGLCIILLTNLLQSRYKTVQEFFGHISNYVQENIAGVRIIKAYVQGPAQTASFDELNQLYLQKNRHLIRIRSTYRPLAHVTALLGLGLILWYGGNAVVADELSIGEFVAFNTYLILLIHPLTHLASSIDGLRRAQVAMNRINEVMDFRPEVEDSLRQVSSHLVGSGRIEFRGLYFTYDQTTILKNINLNIPVGSTIGITGRVGSGKTTLVRLILRLIEANPGQLLIDGKSIENWSRTELWEAIGYVAQVPFLFSDTIRANISYGLEQVEENQILTAAEQALIRKDVEQFASGFDTLIGERGVTLSGGQKQRTALARTLIRKPSILIIDDALSAVDAYTEAGILRQLRELRQGLTTIFIAHRIPILRQADYIIVLDDGCIVERGSHDDLKEQGGFYADLFIRQQLTSEVEGL
ncbi:MAG: ABC transporter ATP-binding protein [Gemmatimonadota bacterium]|nr:ABC transporter ATP-binding protein [Gemmatimonadota bacterium]